jgi:serine/threonine protein kinase
LKGRPPDATLEETVSQEITSGEQKAAAPPEGERSGPSPADGEPAPGADAAEAADAPDHAAPPAKQVIAVSGEPPAIGTEPTCTTSPGAADTTGGESLIGRVLDNRYEVLRKLGAGAMGVVYEVRHLRLDKRFAMKVIHGELVQVPEFVARFEREALACSRLSHPNTINVTDFGRAGSGELYLVMEFVEGKSILDLVRDGPLPVDQALESTRQVLVALQQAHGAGVIHRDIKPDNIMLVENEDGGWQVKVLDFGIAKAPVGEGGHLTQAGVVFGTPQYMAPEQAMSSTVDARADLYAMGATLWRMLTGRPLFAGENPVEILGAKLSSPAPTLEETVPGVYSASLTAFMRRALERRPADRFGSAEEMLEAVTAIQGAPGGGLATDAGPKTDTLRQLAGRGAELARHAGTLVRDWYTCEGHPSPSWRWRMQDLIGTRRGNVVLGAAGGALLLLVLLIGLPVWLADDEVAVEVSAQKKDKPWLQSILVPTPDKPAIDPRIQKQLGQVRSLLEKGACGEAAAELTKLLKKSPDLAEAHYLLGAARMCRHEHHEGLQAYTRAIRLDTRYRRDVRVLEHCRDLLQVPDLRMTAVEFLGTVVGAPALPTLVDAASSHQVLPVRRRAAELVEKLGGEGRIDWVASLSLDLAQLPDAEDRCQAARRLIELGDVRALPALRRARDATVRSRGWRFWRRAWRNKACRQEIVEGIKQLAAKKKKAR